MVLQRYPRIILLFLLNIHGAVFSVLDAQNYFQQEVNHTIKVCLDDQQHMLHAFQTITYINNSADSLGFIYVHLWPNAYANNETGLAKQLMRMRGDKRPFGHASLIGSIDSLDFRTEGKKMEWHLLSDTIDICKLYLIEKLLPGDTVIITTPFRVRLPKGVSSRLGHIGESYQISQWYPKPAVYDLSGWHPMQYLDQGEFYGEFGKFDVSITLPENYTVGASANLLDVNELKRMKAMSSDTGWYNNSNKAQYFPPSAETMKTIRFYGTNIHDFAWFADKSFHVVQNELSLPDSGKKVAIRILFTDNQSELWKDAAKFSARAIEQLSAWVGDYPYQTFTVVQSPLAAGAGMEYPGLAVIGQVESRYALDEVIFHEAAHNWFYSALGNNERDYPYLDESIASAFELRYMEKYYPDKKLWEVFFANIRLAKFFNIDHLPVKLMSENEWLVAARTNTEQPINTGAAAFGDENYGTMVYNKAGQGFAFLRASIGDSLFDASMQLYYRNWKFKHPQPNDLREAFEMGSTHNLAWFFDDFLRTCKRLDYKIIRLKDDALLVKNKGQLKAPLHLVGMKEDSVQFEQWTAGFTGRNWISFPKSEATELLIDPFHQSPELYRLNNNIRTSGIFPRFDPVQLQLYFTLEESNKRKLHYIPAINWNRENGWMLGLALHNGFMLPKKLEYFFMPLFSFGKRDVAGIGKVAYRFIPFEAPIRMGVLSIEGTRFAAPGNQNYHQLKLGLDLYLRQVAFTSPYHHKVGGKLIFASDLNKIKNALASNLLAYVELTYQFQKVSKINPYTLLTSYEKGASHQKLKLSLNYRYSYQAYNTGLDIRFFSGLMLDHKPDDPFYMLAPGARSGREQYVYNGIYPDRFSSFPKTFWSRQMTIDEGGLISYVNDSLGYSKWIVSVNIESHLPVLKGKLPVKPFLNLLLTDHRSISSKPSFFFEAGFKAGIWNLFEVYFPLIVSDQLATASGSFKGSIRFVLHFDAFQKIRMN